MNGMNDFNSNATLLQVYDCDNDRFKRRVGRDRAAASYKKLLQSRGYVADYLADCCQCSDIPLAELTPQFISDFSAWLSYEKRLHGGTVWLACQHLKGVVSRAHQRGLLAVNPFFQFRIAKNIRPRQYLTLQELRTVMAHDFAQEPLRQARDLFVFMAFTGLSFVDVKELDASQLQEIDGCQWIVARRHKTKVPYQVKLLAVPRQILNRRGNLDSGPVFDVPLYHTLAKRLARVMESCGIAKPVTLHCARHTFAVLALNQGVPIESLSRMLGHSNITTTQIYAKITMRKLDQDLTMLGEKLQTALGPAAEKRTNC